MQYLDAISKTTGWSVCFQGKPFNITVIQVYALTGNAEEAEVEQFYEDLQDLLELTPSKDVFFIIGDWKAKVGSQETPGVTDKFGLGVQNETGQRLIEFCQENKFVQWLLGLQGDPTSPSQRKSVLNIHWKDWCWSWSSNTLTTWWEEQTHWKNPDAGQHWRKEEGMAEDEKVGWQHWLDGHEFEQARRWWWTGKPGVLQYMGSQSWIQLSAWMELNWLWEHSFFLFFFSTSYKMFHFLYLNKMLSIFYLCELFFVCCFQLEPTLQHEYSKQGIRISMRLF